ncbi:N-acetylmannosamine-6-phosphate 2-epimerase [cyanobacterium endosymbiont of Epithemia turgida]|uniref:N-acetylmannosamine-6-phosphate 2-epimerase n=1 Tax=cyanobacterium endosymbiont of Epithemia turgida TaxID=718217 RepID=UPI0004D19FB1|nr:N-acetylmannosamine-6-phosphate 2-epimerase [cyanobacterium endosymbiont of Epithemia turgida]BAP18079.1 N-acetylmannosamine-6-phosphate 2-epimerase [cyanobacterium endosymbiont of Epithemia turgida isolate EtSB Lake Yunoko]
MKIPQSSLLVSCQSPINSPLNDPEIIAAIAKASINQGAKGIRVDTPSHVKAVRKLLPNIPIIGLWKRYYQGYDVYITPCFSDAVEIANAGADIIAIDATLRNRPQEETMVNLIKQIHQELGTLVMADVDTIENALASSQAGADYVGTTLYGYTKETERFSPPGYSLLQEMVEQLNIPIICEGGVSNPQDAKKALEYGAHSVVVGTAITGIDLKVKAFNSVFIN